MKRAYIKYFLALLLFGSNGIVASHIVLNSYEIVFLRTLIGSAFLVIVFLLMKGKKTAFSNKKHLLYLVISGIAMGASWMFLYESYSQIGVSLATLAYYCGPVIVMVLSPLVFHERISVSKVAGFTIVLLGMFLVNGEGLQKNGLSWGLLCGILSAVTYSFMVIFNKKASSITGLENSTYQLIVSFLTVSVFVFSKHGIAASGVLQNFLPVLVLGIVNTGIGCYLYFSSIQKLPAGSVAICGYLEPLSALVFSALLLHERLTIVQLFGAVLILSGALLGELWLKNTSSSSKIP